MVMQSVIAQSSDVRSGCTGNTLAKGKISASGFSVMFEGNMKSQEALSAASERSGNSEAKVKRFESEGTSKAMEEKAPQRSVSDQNQSKISDQDTDKIKEASSTSVNHSETVEEKELTELDSDKKAPDEKVLAELAGLLQTVAQSALDILKLSQEDFNQLLKEQNMSVTDLLEPDSLTQFILAGYGETEITAVLTNENLADAMKELTATMNELQNQSESGFTVNQMNALLMQVREIVQAGTDDNQISQTEQSKIFKLLEENQLLAEAVNAAKEPGTAQITESDEDITDLFQKPEIVKESDLQEQSGTTGEEQKEFKASEQFQTFIDHLVNSSQEIQTEFSGNTVPVSELREIANQIIDRIKVSITQDHTSMELQLNPEHLGKVNLTLQSQNGIMTAHFQVQNEVAKEAIEGHLQVLREALNSQEIKVEAIEVTVAASAFEQYNQDTSQNQNESGKSNNGRKITLDEALDMTEIPEEEAETEQADSILGRQIDYTA